MRLSLTPTEADIKPVLEYMQKITNKEMNQQTNEAWKLEDVPMLWRAKVEAMLEQIVGDK
jgi:hypothetical protein